MANYNGDLTTLKNSIDVYKRQDTDRGLRIKTRRGRGQDSVIQDVIFENIRMDGVGTPFVANSFYFCDFDGKTDYVQARHPLPVDERTPEIKSLYFRNINVTNARHAAAFLYGCLLYTSRCV